MIRVWAWVDAPKEYRDLSGNCGDEDYVMHIPAEYKDDVWVGWATESGHPFGVCDVEVIDLPDGSQIRIGSHA